MTIDYRAQTVLLTGASSGTGAAFARTLAARGANLVLVARRADRLTSLADELRQAVTERGIHVTGLINNAAFGSFAPFIELDPDQLSADIAVNALAPMRLTAAFLPGW